MRTANRLSGDALFEWQYFAPDSEPVSASSGIIVPTRPLSEALELETLIVCASNTAQHFDNPAILKFLRGLDRQEVNLGSVSSGSFILAKAGLLDNCRCTIHWENIPVFKEIYPSWMWHSRFMKSIKNDLPVREVPRHLI
jgi:transcriptional regulator GlxA family with amidase domain